MKKLFLSLMLLLPLMNMAQDAIQGDDVVFIVIEQMPEFPGGQQALIQFLKENVHYPKDAEQQKAEGRVICQFVVEKDGSITDINVRRSAGHPSLDQEAVRVIQSMPKWKPGEQQNKVARVRCALPINFKLNGKSDVNEVSLPAATMPELEEKAKVQKAIEQKSKVQKTNARKMGSFTDGESFYVVSDKTSKPIMTPDGLTISPNLGFTKARLMGKAYIMAKIQMYDDTMKVIYTDTDKDQIIKIERYLYDSTQNEISIDGEQVYFLNKMRYCSEMIANGNLKRTIWYDAHRQKERIYMFKNGKDVTELQFYPSGKVSIRTEHFGTPEAVQSVYAEDGSDGEWQPAAPIGEPEDFDTYFNKHFRYNKLYTKEVFKLHVTVDTLGNCFLWVFEADGNPLTRMECKDVPLWSPATVNGRPVQSSFFRYVSYNPMEYISSSDTLPMHNMQSIYTTYNGIRWINSRIYSFVSTDTCSLQGTLTESEDTTFLYCFDKQSGNLVARQRYVENEYGKKVKEGWFTYYADNKKSYEELYVNDTVHQAIHYDENEVPKMRMIRETNRKGAAWDSLYYYYSDGTLKMVSVPDDKDDVHTYYDKQGNQTKEVVQPMYPGKEKALNKYLKKNVKITDSKLWKLPGWTSVECWADFFVEVDETGKVLNIGKGASSCTQNYKITPLTRQDIDILYELIKEAILSNPMVWEPGRIQGEPTTMYTKVHVKYSYTR